jgi:hypothetical protein
MAYALFTTLFQIDCYATPARATLCPAECVCGREECAAAETAATHRDVYLASAAALAQVTQLLRTRSTAAFTPRVEAKKEVVNPRVPSVKGKPIHLAPMIILPNAVFQ